MAPEHMSGIGFDHFVDHPVFECLARGLAPATAGEIAEKLPVSRQAVVKHLAVLESAGLAEGTREGRRVVYRLTPGEFAAAARWMGDVGAAWDRRLAALAARIGAPG